MDLPAELLYSESHEWVSAEKDGIVVIGVTDHAQASLGDVVYVELPEVDQEYGLNDEFGVVESVKAASDLYMPIAGTVVEVNERLEDEPELINSSPYGDGWIAKVKIDDPADLDELLQASAYEKFLESEEG